MPVPANAQQSKQMIFGQQQRMQEQQQINQMTEEEVVAEVREKPRRPLSAYNLFFKEKRKELLKDRPVRPEGVPLRRGHGKMGFAEMAKTIASMWNIVDPAEKAIFEAKAMKERIQYKKDLARWKKLCKSSKKKKKSKKASATNNTNGCSIALPSTISSDPAVVHPEGRSSPAGTQSNMNLVSANNVQPINGQSFSLNSPSHVPSSFGACQPQPQGPLSESSFGGNLGGTSLQSSPFAGPCVIRYFQPDTQVFQQGIQDLSDQFDDETLNLFVNLFRA